MSEQAARSWLSSHHDIIPALAIYHRQALETLENHTKTVRDLANIVALDPGMSVSLYHEVNSRLHIRHLQIQNSQIRIRGPSRRLPSKSPRSR